MEKVFIIAEAGVNHNGDINIAKKMIDIACEAGVDAIKFQTFNTDTLVIKGAGKADYQTKNTGTEETQYEMLKKLELSRLEQEELFRYCEEKKIMFLSTPFDVESVEFLNNLPVSIMKIPSGEITNYPYLRAVGKTGREVILSTGMSDLKEVKEAVSILKESGTTVMTVLHCNTQYPTPEEDVNLRVIKTLEKELQLPVGYSDHTLGIEIPIAAAALGAKVIEKHFTLDRSMEGPDHRASLEPVELKAMVSGIRKIEKALGSEIKRVSDSEKENIKVARKSIVALRDIEEGEVFTEENITTKRPGTGISPMKWNEILGKKAIRQFQRDELIEV